MRIRSNDQLCRPILLKNGSIKCQKSRQLISMPIKIRKTSNAKEILKKRTIMINPPSDISQNLGIQHSISSSYSPYEYKPIEELPSLNSVPEEKFNDLLRKKLDQCCKICNFSDVITDLKSKNLKAKHLKEILEHISQPHFFNIIEPETFKVFFRMLKCNIIRSLPLMPEISKYPFIGEDIKDSIFESVWKHLDIIYKIFIQFLEYDQIDNSQVIHYIDSKLVYQFLMIFNSADQRERYVLKIILHQIYIKYNQQRMIIRKAIRHVFYTYLYETKFFCGVNELLEIIFTIISGYFVPLREEHKNFLIKILLPLYTSNNLYLFHTNLFNCMDQYIQKDPQLITIIIKKMLRCWPITNQRKELFFLNHIGKYIEKISDFNFVQIMEPLINRIGQCIASNNSQISENAMLLWKSNKFSELTICHSNKLFPIIYPYLYKTGANHWNTSIRNLSISIIRIFMDLSLDVYEVFSKSISIYEQKKMPKLDKKKNNWMLIIRDAASNDIGINVCDKSNEVSEVFTK